MLGTEADVVMELGEDVVGVRVVKGVGVRGPLDGNGVDGNEEGGWELLPPFEEQSDRQLSAMMAISVQLAPPGCK